MAGEGEVNPVDPVRRKVQHARGEPRNIERNGDNHHWAFRRAGRGIGLRAILEKETPLSPGEYPRAKIGRESLRGSSLRECSHLESVPIKWNHLIDKNAAQSQRVGACPHETSNISDV